jgi:hypothetical protein
MFRNLLLAGALCLAPASMAMAQDIDFDEASDTSGFATDRYQPAVLAAGAAGGGRSGVLAIGTDASDGASSRPSGFGSAFYNTQGVKFDLDADVNQASVEFYIPGMDWATGPDDRLMGLWGLSDTGAYPIVEFARVSGVDQFRVWDSAGLWVSLGMPTGFSYNSWQQVGFSIDAANDLITYTVGDLSASVGGYGSTSLTTGFFEVHNTNAGVTRTQFMDNFSASVAGAVPEPSTWAMLILGFGLVGGAMRRRTSISVRYA